MRILVVVAACCIPLFSAVHSTQTGGDEVVQLSQLGTRSVFGTLDEIDVLPQAPDDLQYAFIIFRHGIRSPLSNPFQSVLAFLQMWRSISGRLTSKGEHLMFHVGKSLGTRYKAVPVFDTDIVELSSTNIARARQSTQCVAAGLFDGKGPPLFAKQKGKSPCKNTNTDLLKIQRVDYDKNYIMNHVFLHPCSTYKKLKRQSRKELEAQPPPMRLEYFEKLSKCVHQAYPKWKFAKSLQASSAAYDTIQAWILDDRDIKIPQCISHALPVIQKAFQLRLWHDIHSKTNMVQYYTGPILQRIFDEINAVKKSSEKNSVNRKIKVHFHGSHDLTVSPLMWVIGKDEKDFAHLGEALIIEVTADDIVRVFLYNPLGVEKAKRFQSMPLEPLCGKEDCKLAEFKEALKDFAFDEKKWKELCKDKSKLNSENRPLPHDIDSEDLKTMDEALGLVQDTKLK